MYFDNWDGEGVFELMEVKIDFLFDSDICECQLPDAFFTKSKTIASRKYRLLRGPGGVFMKFFQKSTF